MLSIPLKVLLNSFKTFSNFSNLGKEDQECYIFWTWWIEQCSSNKSSGIGFHIPNEVASSNHRVFGSKLAAVGRLKGIPDYIFIKPDKAIGIEFKAAKGKMSSYQKDVANWFGLEKIPYYLVFSAKEAQEVLIKEDFALIN